MSSGEFRRGVGIVLINDQRRIFVGERFTGSWHMPQGGLEEGESPVEGAFRELEEETGTRNATVLAEHPDWLRYEIPKKWRPKGWENRYCGQEQKWFCMRFDGTDDELTVETDEPEFRQWKWATVDEVIAGAIEFKRELYPAVFAAFRGWL